MNFDILGLWNKKKSLNIVIDYMQKHQTNICIADPLQPLELHFSYKSLCEKNWPTRVRRLRERNLHIK